MDGEKLVTDRALLARINSGGRGAEQAFEELVRLHYTELVRFAEYMLGSPDMAEDVVCEVFARLWPERKDWSPRTTIIAYLVAAVRNRAITLRRAERRRSSMAIDVANELDLWMGRPERAGSEVERAEQIAHLRGLLNELPDTAREAVVLRWIHEMSFEEIADVLGTSQAAVQMQISRALRKLREVSGE